MTLTGRTAKIVVVALAVSVLLNFVAVGFAGSVIGAGLMLRDIVSSAAGAYPPELRTAFRKHLRADRREVIASLRALRQAREEQHGILTAEHFDRAAAEAAAARVRETGVAAASVLQTILLDSVEGLPDNVRREIPMVRPLSMRALGGFADEPVGNE